MPLYGILIAVALLSGCGVGKPSQRELEMVLLQQEPRLSSLLEKIEKYRSDNGRYPGDLQAINAVAIPSITLPSHLIQLRENPASYEVARDHSFFRLTYGITDPEDYELHASSSYLSFEKVWKIERHIERFPLVEAKHFGAQYQQVHSAQSLKLAISSLLEAARSSAAYPCRNLWGGWIDEALGAGKLKNRPLPDQAIAEEVRLYSTTDMTSAYAIAIDSKTFRNSKSPSPFVVGVYALGREGKAWVLVQQCDSSP